MIDVVTYIDTCRWRLHAIFLQSESDVYEIADILSSEGCKGTRLQNVLIALKKEPRNVGITYSDSYNRNSIIVCSVQDSIDEMLNTICHEIHHVVCNICSEDDVPYYSELSAYICGDVSSTLLSKILNIVVM